MKNNWVALIRWPLPPQATNNLFPLMMMMVRRLEGIPKKFACKQHFEGYSAPPAGSNFYWPGKDNVQ